MSSLLVGVPPLHRIGLLTAKQKLGLPLDDRNRDTQARLAALAISGMLPLRQWLTSCRVSEIIEA